MAHGALLCGPFLWPVHEDTVLLGPGPPYPNVPCLSLITPRRTCSQRSLIHRFQGTLFSPLGSPCSPSCFYLQPGARRERTLCLSAADCMGTGHLPRLLAESGCWCLGQSWHRVGLQQVWGTNRWSWTPPPQTKPATTWPMCWLLGRCLMSADLWGGHSELPPSKTLD